MLRKSGETFVSTCSGDARRRFELVGLLFRMYAAYSTASPQNVKGRRLAKIMDRAIFRTVRCIRFALPFEA